MRMQGRRGMVLAFVLGLAVATAGTATAAKLITGKQIKNGSIARKDLSTGVRAELSETAKPGAQGAAGPAGPAGPQGPAGAKGADGVVPAPEAPHTVTSFLNNWVQFGTSYPVTYWKDGFGVVHLTGGLKAGTVSEGITSVPIFTLPAGYRPATVQYVPVVSTGGGPDFLPVGGAYLEICGAASFCAGHAGEIAVYGADNAYFSLDGITFRAG
jgi:hypothetical protein